MSKKAIGWVIVVLVVAGLIWWGGSKTPTGTGPIKIGSVSPLSGPGASFGETAKNAEELAIEEINNNGGVDGRALQIIYEDGKCDGKEAVTAAQKLTSVDRVRVILGGICSSETLAMAPITESAKTVLFSSFSSSPAVSTAGDYVFRNGPSDADVAALDANLIVKMGYKRIALLSENVDYSIGVRKVMNGVFANNKSNVVADELFASDVSDFKTVLLKIKATDPDVIYLNPGTNPKTGGTIVKQARSLGLKMALHGNFSLATADAIGVAGKSMDGVIVSNNPLEQNEQMKKFLQAYKAKFGKAPANDLLAGAAYDQVYIIKGALEKVGDNAAKIKSYLYGLKYSGTIGNYRFDKNGDVVGEQPFFENFVIKDGKTVSLD